MADTSKQKQELLAAYDRLVRFKLECLETMRSAKSSTEERVAAVHKERKVLQLLEDCERQIMRVSDDLLKEEMDLMKRRLKNGYERGSLEMGPRGGIYSHEVSKDGNFYKKYS